MRTTLFFIAFLALVAASQCQDNSEQVERVHPRLLQTLERPLNRCRVAYKQLVGRPSSVNTSNTERECFYSCDVKSASWYTWNLQTKVCQCFTFNNISGVLPSPPPTVTPSFDYFVYGNILACFPFCSVAVNRCARCNVRNGNLTCVYNYSRRRCCCVPPAVAVIRNGLLQGCTQFPEQRTARQALEERRQAIQSIDPMFQVMTFDSLGLGNTMAMVGDVQEQSGFVP